MKFAIAIPTYNRVEALKRALSHIEKQIIPEGVDLYCVISNTASTDGTHEFLSGLTSQKIRYVIHSSLENSIYVNWRKCFEIIPPDMDWVWFHGDDDYLFDEKSLQIVCDQIRKLDDANLSLVHPCQARRSRNSGKVFKGTLLDLCNQIGYHEMLGWMSSLVVRADRFLAAMLSPQPQVQSAEDALALKISAYSHSAKILEYCYADQAVFIDFPLVEPQDVQQTKESVARWAVEAIGERYFFVVDDLLKLKDKGVLSSGVTKNFFRYLNGNLWDRYINFIFVELINTGSLSDRTRQHIERLRSISTLLAIPSDVKIYLEMYFGIEERVNRHLRAVQDVNASRQSIMKHIEVTNSNNYSFQILNESAGIQS